MYRRLKNLLGVSLIILAIVLSQLPMEAVQADTATDAATEENTGDLQADVNTPDVGDGTDTTENEGGNDTKTDNENNGGNDTNTNNGNEGGNDTNTDNENDDGNDTENNVNNANSGIMLADEDESKPENPDTNGETGENAGTTTSSTVEVKFDYGFLNLSPTVTSRTVESGKAINIEATDWKITDESGQERLLEVNQYYKIKGVTYMFVGWCTDRECSTKWDMEVNTVKDDDDGIMPLYASWDCEDDRIFTIRYSAMQATSSNTLQKVDLPAGNRIIGPPAEPTRTGYTFKGWFDNDDNPINWDEIPTGHKTYYARWEDKEYTVTFHANGGRFADNNPTVTIKVLRDNKIGDTADTGYPTIDSDSYPSYTVETDSWYIDQECLIPYVPDKITSVLSLYKKWYQITEDGFQISADGKVLYAFTGTQADVVIPSTVRIIAKESFADMSKISSITLPAGVADIKENAFSGANSVVQKIKIYASSDGTNDSMVEGEELAKRYKCFEYIPLNGTGGSNSGDTGRPELSEKDINCSLSGINTGIDDNPDFVYPKIYLPTDLPGGNYEMVFTELNTPTTIKKLLEAAMHNLGAEYVYYMDIKLQNKNNLNETPTWSAGTMTISMPLPVTWYGRDTSKIHMYTVNTAGTALEEVSISSISNNIFTFHPKHFSEFALVFTGSLTQQGGSNSGGGSGNGGSSGGSGGSGNSSSSSSSSTSGGSSSSGTGTTPSAPTITPAVTTPNQPLPIVTPVPGVTQPVVTTPTGTGGNAGGSTAHVKDSTPKTGDPLEYRSLLVCCFFSIGVLLLLIGNKKKTSASSQYLQA